MRRSERRSAPSLSFSVRPMRSHALLLILCTVGLSSFAASKEPLQLGDALRQNLLATAPMPDYPYEMRQHHVEGSGVFELFFDYDSGRLREVHVVKSTGSQMLDGYAIGALKLWKAKPHAVNAVLVPVRFTMTRQR